MFQVFLFFIFLFLSSRSNDRIWGFLLFLYHLSSRIDHGEQTYSLHSARVAVSGYTLVLHLICFSPSEFQLHP
jgi:hypothetical protein